MERMPLAFHGCSKKFIDCMGVAPSLIITDQDLGMKVAIQDILVGTRHRWCMWHIMIKVADKVSKDLQANEGFKKQLSSCAWSETIEPHIFEKSWGEIMENYGLKNDKWFKSMYEARKFWVPAYFRDFPLSGLLRTTSIAESENNIFKRYTRCRSNLLEFIMKFNNAIEAQRHNNAKLNYMDKAAVPMLQIKTDIEKHAASVYTCKTFMRVGDEIMAAYRTCRMIEMYTNDNIEYFKVKDGLEPVFQVFYKKVDDEYDCECKMFCRMGFLCRHIFFVLKNKDVRVIPDKYLLSRWKKMPFIKPVHDLGCNDVDSFVAVSDNQRFTNKIISSVFGWMEKLDGNCEKMSDFLAAIDSAGRNLSGEDTPIMTIDKDAIFEKFYGPVPEKIDIHPPDVVKTKGSGRRLISDKERQIRKLNKPLRLCAKCKKMSHHDARNCDKVNARSAEDQS